MVHDSPGGSHLSLEDRTGEVHVEGYRQRENVIDQRVRSEESGVIEELEIHGTVDRASSVEEVRPH
jgi:hypothetical protein